MLLTHPRLGSEASAISRTPITPTSASPFGRTEKPSAPLFSEPKGVDATSSTAATTPVPPTFSWSTAGSTSLPGPSLTSATADENQTSPMGQRKAPSDKTSVPVDFGGSFVPLSFNIPETKSLSSSSYSPPQKGPVNLAEAYSQSDEEGEEEEEGQTDEYADLPQEPQPSFEQSDKLTTTAEPQQDNSFKSDTAAPGNLKTKWYTEILTFPLQALSLVSSPSPTLLPL